MSISSYYYISHKTVRTVLRNIHGNASFQDILKWLSLAEEYNELPVRGGEAIMNIEMSAQSRYKVEDTFEGDIEVSMIDPHVKAFLLLQAHLSRVDLPIADYIQDTVSVLDQSLRILQAFIDIASEMGYLATVMTLIKVMQCIKQGCWYEDNPVTLLPGCDIQRFKDIEFRNNGYPTKPIKTKLTLQKLASSKSNEYKPIIRELNVSRDFESKFLNVVKRIPALTNIRVLEQTNPSHLQITAQHVSGVSSRNMEVYCDRFPKTQKELWFCIGYQNEELLIIKRCQPRKTGKIIELECDLLIPEELYGENLTFTIVNDAMDLQYTVNVQLQEEL